MEHFEPRFQAIGRAERLDSAYASVRFLSLHVQIRIEELQRSVPDVIVQFRPIHARSIDAGVGIVVASHLIALIVEYLMANLTRQHVELGMRDIFRSKLGVFLGRRCCVARTNNDIRWDCRLPKPGVVHAKTLNVPRSHCKCCFHSIVVHVGFQFLQG